MDASPVTPARSAGANAERWPALGLGTWRLGEQRSRRSAEVQALRLALEIGYRLIDTAEMYGEGGAEEVVGEALAGATAAGLDRSKVFVVSKLYPHHASRAGVLSACERSLRRLRIDQIDLYLLHWRGAVPLRDTLAGFAEARRRGWIRHWGVSNFDVNDLEELVALDGGDACAANQVYYSLGQRGVEFDLLPWMQSRSMPLMAYCPIDQGALAGARAPRALQEVAARHGATPAQVALAAVLAPPGVIAIPKSAQAAHLRENWGAQAIALDAADRTALDAAFPPPRRKRPLAMT
jgi:diketogulonate reductase-like aldo/keto reductase